MSAKTTKRKPTTCAHCRTIRDLMKPTMSMAKPDSIAVMIGGDLFRRIYANAKRGAK